MYTRMSVLDIRGLTLVKQIKEDLVAQYGSQEAMAMARLLVQKTFNLDYTQLVANPLVTLLPAKKDELRTAIEGLRSNKPIQYIFKEAWFYGRPFKVGPGVLIPRPETEELVHKVLALLKQNFGAVPHPGVLDCGTGSGCIPVTLALEQPHLRCTGLDTNRFALEYARQNAQVLQAKVPFVEHNMLKGLPAGPWHAVVSNPPYVLQAQKAQMHANVLDHEPHDALFVPENKPLLFYEALAQHALPVLVPGGLLAVEINEDLAPQTLALFQAPDWKGAQVYNDMQNKPRMLNAFKAAV